MYKVLEYLNYDLEMADTGNTDYVEQLEQNIATVNNAINNELSYVEREKLKEVFTTYFEDSSKDEGELKILNSIMNKLLDL